MQEDTITAISTSPGKGGIAIIRISGPAAIDIADKITDFDKGTKIHDLPANSSRLTAFLKGEEIIDEGLVTVYRAPHSYSGEDTVELSCHGSIYIQQQLLQVAIDHGARLAEPGEFTRRAFLNGKLDLSQAEAVADLIASSTAAAHKTALQQMRGGFSKRLSELREQLVNLSSLLELELDFSEEDVEFANRNKLKELAKDISDETDRLIQSFDLGNAIKNGIPVVIAGRPNVGKSTLLNNLLQEDKAIVSDIAGTTRDFIEDTINVEGITFRFIDTAGLRDSEDTIEQLGIQRTHEKISQASIILLMVE
ncbi:MAG: tRNA uridine-5-carboxymethylaminomethyl(34) synthesis GTPase MnmE, partial [Bacteroidota bacterium]